MRNDKERIANTRANGLNNWIMSMAAFSRLHVGDTLFDCRMMRMGNTTMREMCTWKVRVIKIDTVKGQALCSWNGNTPEWWDESRLKSLRRSPPR